MKNVFKLLGITALAAVIGLSFAGCAGEDSPEPATPQKMVYTWDAGDDSYELEITEASEGRAVYTPKTGDTYVLTITLNVGGTQKSSGIVTVSSSSGKESTLTLKPANSNTTFTVTVVATATNVLVESVDGEIVVEDGEKVTVSGPVIPVKVYETFVFWAEKWTPTEAFPCYNESWKTDPFNLSDFTTHIPTKGDTLTFRFSGTTNKEMKGFEFQIVSWADSEPWRFIGSSKDYKLSETFDQKFDVPIYGDPYSNTSGFGLYIVNYLWESGLDGEIYFDTGDRLPEGAKDGDVMATVRNFRLSLVNIESE